MNLMPKVIPADVAYPPYEKYMYLLRENNLVPIIVLLITLLVVAAIVTIILVATGRKNKKNQSKIEEKENDYELDT